MKKIILILILCLMPYISNAKSYHYKSGSFASKTYYSTGYPRHRSMSARNEFLHSLGYGNHPPKGYQVDHIKPLSVGGLDSPSNMQLLSIPEHRAKTAREHRLYSW